MSDVMTSRSMPSRGTKYSFWRADAAADWAAGGGGLFCCLCISDGRLGRRGVDREEGEGGRGFRDQRPEAGGPRCETWSWRRGRGRWGR